MGPSKKLAKESEPEDGPEPEQQMCCYERGLPDGSSCPWSSFSQTTDKSGSEASCVGAAALQQSHYGS
jgi:hypothetical protein